MKNSISVGGIRINTGYSATITQQSGVNITVGLAGYSQASGTFTGGAGAFTVGGDMTISDGIFQTARGEANPISVTGTLLVDAKGVFIARYSSLEGYGAGQTITVGNLTINGTLNADGEGFLRNNGPSRGNGGGSHGGGGSNGSSVRSYGSLTNPTSLGGGGYDGYSSRHVHGGGAIIISCAGTVTVNGALTANGTDSTFAGGAGGSINITTGALVGAGIIKVNGGSCNSHNKAGGGRIAVRLTGNSAFDFSKFQAYSDRKPGKIGGPGTIYLQTAAQGEGKGTLVIDNGRDSSANKHAFISSDVSDTSVGSLVLQNEGQLTIDAGQTLSLTGTGTNLTINSRAALTNNGTLAIAGNVFNSDCEFINNSGSTILLNGCAGVPPASSVASVPACDNLQSPIPNLQSSDGNQIVELSAATVLGTIKSDKRGGTLTFMGGFTANTLEILAGNRVSFESAQTFNVTNLIISGTAEKSVELDGASDAASWKLNLLPGGAQTTHYVKIHNSDASLGLTADGTYNCVDLGFNTNWDFGNGPIPPNDSSLAFRTAATSITSPAWVEGYAGANWTSVTVSVDNGPSFAAAREPIRLWYADNSSASGAPLGITLSPTAPRHVVVTALSVPSSSLSVSSSSSLSVPSSSSFILPSSSLSVPSSSSLSVPSSSSLSVPSSSSLSVLPSSSFILHPSSFILPPSSFLLPPSSFIIICFYNHPRHYLDAYRSGGQVIQF